MSDQNMSIHLIAGGLAGATGSIVTCPLEVVKTRFQSSTNSFHKCMSSNSQLINANSSLPVTHNCSSTNSGTGVGTSNNTGSASTNRLKLTSSKPTNTYFNSNILFKNNHLNITTNAFNLDTHLTASHQHNIQYSLKTSCKTYQPKAGTQIFLHFKFIIQNEGYRALFKGIGPNLAGVAPYRAIYFFSYANSKQFLASFLGEERPLIHVFSAFIAGFSAVTITNPIWFVKTRLQLDESRRGLTTLDVVNKIMKEKGPIGFYKGITASYFGIIESAMYFAIYEKLKMLTKDQFVNNNNNNGNGTNESLKFLSYFTSAGFSKTLASCLCYPHEVARTRLRQEGSKYTGFFQTLCLILKEEGARGLYKGMATHLVRQIPNTAIVMTTYEILISYFRILDNSCLIHEEENND